MKNVYKQKRDEGFTIIEVLIVLAIAALILLIVFLAVPALQRNSRNTSRRADVSNILASQNEFASNNNGTLPSTVSGTTTLTWGAGTTSETRVNYYTQGVVVNGAGASGKVVLNTSTPVAGASYTNDAAHDYVTVYEGATCNGTAVAQGGARAVAALYVIENGANTFTAQCLSS